MKIIADCGKINGRNVLIGKAGKNIEYLTCRNYDPSLPEGQQWDGGRYCNNVEDFARIIFYEKYGFSFDHLMEIATQALSYLNDNEMLEEFLEDRDLELEYEERDFFFPEEEA